MSSYSKEEKASNHICSCSRWFAIRIIPKCCQNYAWHPLWYLWGNWVLILLLILICRTSSVLGSLVTVRQHTLHSWLVNVFLLVIFFFYLRHFSHVTSAINFGPKQHKPQSQRSKYLHASLLSKHQGEERVHKSLRNGNLGWIITQSAKLLAL